MGYDAYVKESFQNVAEVYYPKENSTFSENILRNLHFWTDSLELYEADAVHFNVGHWDTVRIYGDEPLTRPEVYADNLERIIKRIRHIFPGAKIIFATSTPVIESGYIEDFESRKNSDVEKYNEIAWAVMEKHGVRINDLHSLMKGRSDELHSDQTHYYTAEATELLGGQVCRVICEELGIDQSELTIPDAQKYHSPKKGRGDREMFEKRGNIYVRKR